MIAKCRRQCTSSLAYRPRKLKLITDSAVLSIKAEDYKPGRSSLERISFVQVLTAQPQIAAGGCEEEWAWAAAMLACHAVPVP